MDKKNLKIEYTRGTGKGGQHKNKTDSCVKITHLPTGITARVDGRDQHQNKRAAMKMIEQRLIDHKEGLKAKAKKKRRDAKIKDKKYIRTYDFKSGRVKNHLNGKTASIKDVLENGKIGLLQDTTK